MLIFCTNKYLTLELHAKPEEDIETCEFIIEIIETKNEHGNKEPSMPPLTSDFAHHLYHGGT